MQKSRLMSGIIKIVSQQSTVGSPHLVTAYCELLTEIKTTEL